MTRGRTPRVRWTTNPNVAPTGPYPSRLDSVIGLESHRSAHSEITSWPHYTPTPLRSAHDLASRLGVASVHVKDESGRFGLGSFKALGGAYGVLRAVERVGPATPTVTCASDGNHGRSVAWGARMFGLNAVVYLPGHVTEVRADAIRSFGARVARVDGEYDDAVAQAARDAHDQGWTVISDTSYPGYMEIPRLVMAGYTIMVEEALEALTTGSPASRTQPAPGSAEALSPLETHRPRATAAGVHWTVRRGLRRPAPARCRTPRRGVAPTHVFVQGGVGGLAAAVIGHLWARLGPERPVAVVVEPRAADGLYRSACAAGPRAAQGDLNTIMAGLSCREISPLAWEVLDAGAHAFMTVRDDGVTPLMRAAARGELGDPFEGGESGVAGLLGLVEAAGDDALRQAVGLGADSRVLAFNTEGATDPELYARIVGSGGGAGGVPSGGRGTSPIRNETAP